MPSRFIGQRLTIDRWGDDFIAPGETRNMRLTVGESYSGMKVRIPIQVRRAKLDGPTLFVTAALHGDEINGTGVIRQLIHDGSLAIERGNLILVPVLNLLAFDRHSRYMPDRRDLNRCFPGNSHGSLASRMARRIFEEIVGRSDFGIDLHTAAVRRTNYPNVRGNLDDPLVARIARAFGTELIINAFGPSGAFRREACQAGCPTIVFEGGEVWKVEPSIVESSIKGIMNVLVELGMLPGTPDIPAHQTVLEKTKWIRAERGGFLQFHVKPGEVVENGQALATHTNLLGVARSVLRSPFAGVILGMTTLPAVTPGEPVCHIGRLPHHMQPKHLTKQRVQNDGLEERLLGELSTNIHVVDQPNLGSPADAEQRPES